MNNFEFKNPTKINFGKGQIASIATEIPKDAKVLMLFGGGSIKANGVYDQVKAALKDFDVVEMGGIPANPEYSVCVEAIDIIKKENITFLLAVGGGSVIDGTKFIAAASLYDGDTWEMVKGGVAPEKALPFGTVLTLPATGSEMNCGAVVSRKETEEKFAFLGASIYPQFSILDPEVIKSLPPKQIANGIADAFVHVLEQYVTFPAAAMVQDRFAEGVLQTLVEVSSTVMADPSDYDAASNYMWSCTMALNGLIGQGVPQDWTIHMVGHELTALFNIDHARTLAILTKNYYTENLEYKKEKLAQLAERVWGVKEGSVEEKALKAIELIDVFYHSLSIDTKLSEYTDDFKGSAEKIAAKFKERGISVVGEQGKVSVDSIEKIIKMSY